MKRYHAGLLTLLLLACTCWGQAITLPKETTGDPGAFVKVPATTTGKEVRWFSPDKGLQVFPVELLKDSKTAVVIANAPGRYRLIAWTAVDGVPSDPAICVVVIGAAPDPGPGPDPGPVPPPTDPLTKALQAAFDKETDADKAEQRKKLAALWRATGELAQAKDAQGAYRVATWGSLFTAFRDAAVDTKVFGKLVSVQQVAQKEMQSRFPSAPDDWKKPMTVDDRMLASDTYKRFAVALEGVK